MGYLDDHLLPDERVVHRARTHWVILGWPIALVVSGVAGLIALYLRFAPELYWVAGAVVAGVGLTLAVGPGLRYVTTEFAITDKRVLAKYGLVRRQSLETLLSKIEAIGIAQSVGGRLLGYGTVTITGTGGTRETLPMLAAPLDFRRRVQAQIVALEERNRGIRGPSEAPISPRLERECPYCAELILVKAKVCKHCGNEIDQSS
jgi:uncharacterized membrane protein YdbT with pleckstrin-like domain